MEIIQLAEKKKAFAPPEKRYQNTREEALKLRKLWTYHKPLNKRKEMQAAKHLFREGSNLLKDEENLEKICRLVNKGLFYDPHFHPLYALKGEIRLRQGKFIKAIANFEKAKLMAEFDNKLSKLEAKIIYNQQLIDAYVKRGDWCCENNLYLEALSDYEQVLLLKLPGMDMTEVQDKLLHILRKLQKYELFRKYWNNFINEDNPVRAADLLTIHAEYKIEMREMGIARYMLLKALNLMKKHKHAQELLQVVFSTGHSLSAYTVIWCMHDCYDKALLTVEKALDCNPYNPGFNLLKTIVLRLSGRFKEATSWLQSLNSNFYKLIEPTSDKEKSIMGKLSINETRDQLIKQWYLIRYDMAMKCMLDKKFEAAIQIIYKSNLVKYYAEPYILLGDCFLKRKDVDLALKSYLKCREKMRELDLPVSRKTIDLTERIIDILNNRAKIAADNGHSKRAIDIANQVLQILDEERIPLHELRLQRGFALICKARGQFQIEKNEKPQKKESCATAADSLRFIRKLNADLYQTMYNNKDIEGVIDRFAPGRKLPRSLKILMQFS